jgi:hypothetical protein
MFGFIMYNELYKVISENPNQPFEFYEPYITVGLSAGSHYDVRTGAADILSVGKRIAMRCNTKERWLMSNKIDSLCNGRGFPSLQSYPADVREKYYKRFDEVYRREMERQK